MKDKYIKVRIENDEKQLIEKYAKDYHFLSVSEFIRFLALNTKITVETKISDDNDTNK